MGKTKWLVPAVIYTLLGLFGLWRVNQYYGRLLHGWDAQFYYAQACSFLFDCDFDVTNNMQQLPYRAPFDPAPDGFLRAPPRRADQRIINKYPIGLSLVEVPMIALGYLFRQGWEAVSGLRSAESPGCGPIEIGTTAVGLLLVTVCGLVLLQRIVARFVDERWATIAVLTGWLGTSLYYYSAMFPFMAHGLSFTLVVLSLRLTERLLERSKNNLGHYITLATMLGFLFLVRTQQVLLILVLVPMVVRSLARFEGGLVSLTTPVAIFGAICTLQVVSNYMQTGRWGLTAYTVTDGSLFDHLFDPALSFVLFNSSRGLLWVSPIVLLALPGCLLGTSKCRWLGWTLFAYGCLQIYVIAASNWPEAGDAFGSRYWCECSPLVAVGLTCLMNRLRAWGRFTLAALITLTVGWTMILLIMFVKGKLDTGATHMEVFTNIRTLFPGR